MILRGTGRERELRRRARSVGFQLIRSRAWNRNAAAYGTYALMDPARGTLELADPATGYGLSLDEIEAFLNRFGSATARSARVETYEVTGGPSAKLAPPEADPVENLKIS